jgi:adenylate cyclase
MACLRFLNGERKNQRLFITGGEVFGRDPDMEIQISAPGVSRRHCQLLVQESGVELHDLGSMNCTYVNRSPITRAALGHGDVINIGGVELEFLEDQLDAEDEGHHTDTQLATVDATLAFHESMADVEGPSEDKVEILERRLRVFYEVGKALASVRNTSELLNRIMAKLLEAFPRGERGLIMVGESIETLQPRVVQIRHGEVGGRAPVSWRLARKVYAERQALIVENISELGDGGRRGSDTIHDFKHRSIMCAPLLYKDECLGFIQIDSRGRDVFQREDLNLLVGITAQASIFVKNDQLYRLTNLERFFPQELAARIISGEIDVKPGGDLKWGTVFFSDIIGFTALSERLSPGEIILLMNRYFEVMVNVVLNHQGYIDKFIGDAIMAVWGAPVAIENESLLAIRAGIEMQNALFCFNNDLVAEGLSELRMGIGLNTGSFVAGNLGSERRMDYTVIGDAVNTAQRIESIAGAYCVFISETTYESVGRRVLVSRLCPTRVKNKERALTVYTVRGVQSDDPAVFLFSMPFFVELEGVRCQGHLVKLRAEGSGTANCQILLPRDTKVAEHTLTFVPQEAPSFEARLQIKSQLAMKQRYSRCYNGLLNIAGTVLDELLTDGLYISAMSPDDLPRSAPLAVR